MSGIRTFCIATLATPLLVACAASGPAVIEARDPKVIHSDASVSDLVVCLKTWLREDATVIAYPEPGKVDIRIADGGQAESKYFHLVSLRQARAGTTVELRSADEWHPLMSAGRVTGKIESCKPGTAR
ncbi:hypothetical protein [Cupriavidus pampae]|jgi:hypothetical protein|uniref:Lipoprotein n=1 Tax=Cupriavidus pampae TaxID=659251 RepID=A0ABM8WI96_9BURK|nr:hypothetical protein [Cupriavidus pampae]CAG9167084.1 hypothetical protein LMG32289_01286 [Cupriavidus pampae]